MEGDCSINNFAIGLVVGSMIGLFSIWLYVMLS